MNDNSSSTMNTSSTIIDTSNDSSNSESNPLFGTSDNPEVTKTTNFFLSSLLKLEWTKTETYESYLQKIDSHRNKYFDIQNYKAVALSTLLLKQLIDIKIKLKEHITKIDLLFDEQWKTRIDLHKMQSAHKKQLISYDQYFNEHASSSDRIHIDQYIRYLTNLFKHKSLKIDANMIRRYAVKTSIEYESEFKYREENLFNWQVDTYEDINTYYSSI